MRKVVLQMVVTVDGFADGEEAIVPGFDTPYWGELGEELAKTGAESVDTVLMGRGTYEQFAEYWPTAGSDPTDPESVRGAARFLNETPKVVFSRTMSKAEWRNSRIVAGDVTEEIQRLKQLPGKNMIVPGGVAFPRTLIERDLVDEYLLTVVPVVLGRGEDRLFGGHSERRNLTLVRSRVFSNGAIFQHYEPVRGIRLAPEARPS
jgi:dihydrofolate reductase